MRFLLGLLTFALCAYYVRVGRRPTARQLVACLLALNALLAFGSGFVLAVNEDARQRYGRVVPGVVLGRVAPGSAVEVWQIYEVLARGILTRSTGLWAVDYAYDCGRPTRCRGRDGVTRADWLKLEAGWPVSVRFVPDGIGGARLDDNAQWATAVAEMALGALLVLPAAALFWGMPALARRVRRLQTTAIVTAVDPVKYLGARRWRVRFAYLDDVGSAREAIDEFAIDLWRVGDSGIAVYEVADPDIATLRRADPAVAHG